MRHTSEPCVACLRVTRFSNVGIAHRLKISGSANPIKVHNMLYLLTLLLFLPSLVFAQVDTGTLSGEVKDTSGASVPEAMVTVRNTATGATRVVQTGSDGVYTVPGLAPALYEVTVSKTGFADYKVQAPLTVGGHVTLDAPLSVSQVSTTVEVVGVATTEVNTQTQEVSQIVTPEQVANLPSLTRNPYDFVGLAGNISGGDRSVSSGNPQIGGSGQNSTDRGVGYSINGQRASGTEILLDGAENTNVFDTTVGLLIPQDSVQEFRVITNNFDAQYGRASGGVVNVVTKSGTNNIHGDAWEFNRLSAYTANTFTNNALGTPKGTYTRNQFGYDIGGPIKKDKLFFYQSTEWLRVRSSANQSAYVPTPQLLSLLPANVQAYFNTFGQGAPSTFLSTVTAGETGAFSATDCAGQTAPAATCGLFLTKVPAATPAFGLVNFAAPVDAGGDVPQNTYTLVGRLDYNLSQNTQIFARYGRESLLALPGSLFAGPYPQYNVGQSIYNNNGLLSVSHTFSSTVLSTTKISFFRDDVAQQYNTALQETPTLYLATANATINGQFVQLPGFFDFNTGTGGLPFGGPQNTLQINQDVSWTKGKHNMRFGGQYNYIQLNRGFGAYAQAVEQLGSTLPKGLDNMANGVLSNFQKAIDPAGAAPCFSAAYSGPATPPSIVTPACTLTFPLSEPSFNRSDRYNDWAIYAEDSWRVTPRLTFNYGLRYEHFGVQHNNNPNLDSNLYYGPGANIFQQINTSQIFTVPNSPIKELWKPRWGTAAPRIGFAYDVFGDGKTAVRGGYGISYERNFGNVTFNIIQNPPNNATAQITGGVAPVSVSNLGPFAGAVCPTLPTPCVLPPVSPRNVAQDIQVAQTQFWGVSIDRRLGNKGVFSLEYNGAHGVHLYDIANVNEIGEGQVFLGQPQVTSDALNPACTAASPCLTRANQQFTSINNRGTRGFSHYNALNVKFQTQEVGRSGVTLQANYTYAHSLDNLSSTFSENSTGSNGVGNLGFTNPGDPWLDYGNSDFDLRHRVALSATWQEPFFKSGKGFLRQVAGGWSISPIFTARTGVPFSVADSSTCLNCLTGPYGIPRYVPSAAIPSFHTGAGTDSGSPNLFNLLTLPPTNSFTGLLGISDFGPYPAGMTTRNAFYGPGAWTFDLAVAKNFALTERFSLEFRAEGYDIFNHVNMYLNGFSADAGLAGGGPVVLEGLKGGLGLGANNGQHDERRFGQFALRLHF
jgi:outer membrane receptor protein involved in Fe transport